MEVTESQAMAPDAGQRPARTRRDSGMSPPTGLHGNLLGILRFTPNFAQ
jgi:hypothetical protein